MEDKIGLGVKTMEFNATFNNISITSWWRKPENPEKINDIHKLYHIMLYKVHLAMIRIQTHNVSDDRH